MKLPPSACPLVGRPTNFFFAKYCVSRKLCEIEPFSYATSTTPISAMYLSILLNKSVDHIPLLWLYSTSRLADK
jgi:hypothetical protein